MKSLFVALLGLLVLAGCALDIAAPAPQPPATKAEYDVSSDGGTVVRHYDGNDALVWIERHVLSPGTAATDPRIKTYHSNAADVLRWYEYRRFETLGGAWMKTREQHYVALSNDDKDHGTMASDKAWSYAATNLPVISSRYNASGALSDYDYSWAEAAAGNRVLQTSTHGAGGAAQSYDRTWFDGASGKKTAHLVLDATLATTAAQSFAYDGDNLSETLEFTPAPATWARELRSTLAGASKPYRTIWYKTPGTAPGTAGFEASPAPAAPALVSTAVAEGSLAAAVLPAPTVSLVALPALNAPTSWPLSALQGFEYVLPGSNGGTTTIRFDKNRLPTVLQRAAQGALGTMEVDFAWDAEKRLTQRLVKYAANPVLTVDLHRDASGRIDRVDTAGSMLKLPLTYTLTYLGTAVRPDTLTLSTGAQNLMTLTYTYDDKFAALASDGAGLDALNFDAHLQKLTVGVDGGSALLNVLALEFPSSFTNPATVSVYDVLNKTAATRKLIGTLTWSFDAALHQTGLVWNRKQPDGTLTATWTYTAGWGTWAALAAGMAATASDTGASLEADASRALALADSFDVEKVLQLVNEARSQANQTQFQRMASSLLDQVKAASGN